jgi:hypothetical protein
VDKAFIQVSCIAVIALPSVQRWVFVVVRGRFLEDLHWERRVL